MAVEEPLVSLSTWQPVEPGPPSPQRRALLQTIAETIDETSSGRLRVAVDGRTGAGKSTFGHELAAALQACGRATARASLDDFKHPWRHAAEHGYDRVSGRGFYENAYDLEGVRSLLLGPGGASGSGVVSLCAHDPLTGIDHREQTVALRPDHVLVVDSVFAMRPELDHLWDLRIRLTVEPATALARGLARDLGREGEAEARRLHEERYAPAEAVYLAQVDAVARADLVIDNTDLVRPALVVDRTRRR
ncbi:hypothetical protein [Nocardioides sp. GXQ0305]|uniref:hypothetical protein n=1 Tax=Nocardioides sp. GXQ0305 TaxID=3423912 RepID=UPI003D7EC2C7